MLLLFSSFLLKNKHNSDFYKFTLVSCLIRHRHIELTVIYSDDILRFLLIQLLINRIRVAVNRRSLTSDQLRLVQTSSDSNDGNFKFTRRRKEATFHHILDFDE